MPQDVATDALAQRAPTAGSAASPDVGIRPQDAEAGIAPAAVSRGAGYLPPPAFAALDLGTNNCRLLIGAPAAGGFRVVDSFSRIVRLGEGLATTGRLADAAMDRALAALAACADKLHRRPLRGFTAVATEACRRAANGAAFLARVEAETGIRPRIITAREEAELAMESCAPLIEEGTAASCSSTSAAAARKSPGSGSPPARAAPRTRRCS